ncbi:MAG: peptidylprolyl isomerase [Actinobacteria bacterium]|jgi:FKBP-type peptidyl-prolyl cis-trans isomerase SlyD|nr:MAG: peptidylprolyl isomerase [Actinomycetota bacterium]
MKVGPNKTVAFDYRLYEEGGELIESSPEDEPLSFVYGEGSIIPGLERELEGMQPGESKEVVVKPEDAYGLRDPELVQQVPRERFAAGSTLEVGMSYVGRTEAGHVINFLITSMDDDKVEIDMNHPLAGTTLRFEVTINDVMDGES